MFKIVERDWLINLRGTVIRFDKTNDYKRIKRNNDGKCFYSAMKNCNVNINDNIYSKVTFPLNTHEAWTQSVQSFLSFRIRVCTVQVLTCRGKPCRRLVRNRDNNYVFVRTVVFSMRNQPELHHTLLVELAWVPARTPSFTTTGSAFLTYKIVHTCRGTLPLTCARVEANAFPNDTANLNEIGPAVAKLSRGEHFCHSSRHTQYISYSRVNMHWSRKGLDGWGYPAKKTACQLDLRFQRFKSV